MTDANPLLFDNATGKPRSEKWPEFRRQILDAQPWCSACGRTESLEVHHIKPFHLHPELELQTTNVIVLCEGPTRCHFTYGHRAQDWVTFDCDCVEFVGIVRQHLDRSVSVHGEPIWPKTC